MQSAQSFTRRTCCEDISIVIGCGAVGLGALASIAARGAIGIAIDFGDAKLALARQAGASHTINTQSESVQDRLLEITGGLRPDVVIEAVGIPPTYVMAVEQAAHGGRVVFIGWSKEPATFDTKLFVHKELDMLGSRNYWREFPEVIDVLRQKQFPVEAAISLTVPFEEAGNAPRMWSESPQRLTKILVGLNA